MANRPTKLIGKRKRRTALSGSRNNNAGRGRTRPYADELERTALLKELSVHTSARGKTEVLRQAREVVSLYQELTAIFGQLPPPGSPGHNRIAEQTELLAKLESDRKTAEAGAKVLNEELSKDEPDKGKVGRVRKAFSTLVTSARTILSSVKKGAFDHVGKYIGEGVGKGAAGVYLPDLLGKLIVALGHVVRIIKAAF